MKDSLVLFTLLVFALVGGSVFGQDRLGSEDYLWPTDASTYLTSAFSEYRGRRFHAGIDIKTWGRSGYKVFAIRPGYVWRISVSPFGYGKSIYIKLDTGEIAQYAHLSRYSDRIQEIVEAEQQRLGRYRLNKYFKPGQLPVQQGEVLAYSGQTGIGAPHLHFEIRDSANRPLNPLSKGYRLPDDISPIVTKVSITPLDATSQVNGDFRPVIVRPKWSKPGEYIVEETATIWGNVGLAVACYDKDSNSVNAFGIYSFKLYVDDVLRFHYRFDDFSFQENRMVELERDYRLYRRKFGRFHKLYKDKHNTKSNYVPNEPWAGVLKSASLEASPSVYSGGIEPNRSKASFQSGALLPGEHDFRIELADFMGNVSQVHGTIRVGEYFTIRPLVAEGSDGSLNLQDLLTFDVRKIQDLSVSLRRGRRWRPIDVDYSTLIEHDSEKGGEGPISEPEDARSTAVTLVANLASSPLILKFVATDQFDVPSYPFYFTHTPTTSVVQPEISVEYDFYDDYLRVELNSSVLLAKTPRVTLYPDRSDSTSIPLHQMSLKQYVGRIAFNQLRGTNHILEIISHDLNGERFSHLERFVANKVSLSENAKLESGDNNFWVAFWPGSLYAPVYGYVTRDESAAEERNMVGTVYHAEPQDVPLNAGARVHLRYPEDETEPEKLGVYYQTRRGWTFINNELNRANRTISAKVFSLEKFVLMRDDVPPEIWRLRPRNQSRLSNKTPRVSANVQDELSGIASENEVVLRLDGRKLISEYDPERNRVFYQVKEPLSAGRHVLTVWVKDRSGNETTRESVFWVE